MRPEFRSTRSATQISIRNSKKAQSPPSLSPSLSTHSSWRKQSRHRMTDDQLSRLDALYEQNTYPTTEDKESLGKDVGLELKAVSVWFQNKRQTEKKAGRLSASLSSSSEQSSSKRFSLPPRNTTTGKRARPPHYTDKYHSISSGRPQLPTPLGSFKGTSMERDTLRPRACQPQIRQTAEEPDDTAIPPAQELWEHLLSSPTVSDESPCASSNMDSRERSPNRPTDNHTDGQGPTTDGTSKRSRMLDWVCDRQAKRRRNNRGDPAADSTDLAPYEEAGETCSNCPQFRRPEFETAISLLMLPGDSVPAEDVLRAASLLLCFKYSAQNPRQAGHP